MKESQNPYATTCNQDENEKAKSSHAISALIGAGVGIAAWPLFLILELLGVQMPFLPPVYFTIAGTGSWFLGFRSMSFLSGLVLGYVVLATPWMAFDPLFPINAVICLFSVLCSVLGMGFALFVSGEH